MTGAKRATKRAFSDWVELYKSGDIEKLPWFSEKLDADLAAALDAHDLKKGSALDLGTGPGTQAIALAKRGFDVTATDISNAAIDYAKKRADKDEAKLTFTVDNVIESKLTSTFDIVFDRGCFHTLAPELRKDYIATVTKLVAKDGWLFVKTFSHLQPGDEGPYRFTEKELREIFGDAFEIESIKDCVFVGQLDPSPKALFCAMRTKKA